MAWTPETAMVFAAGLGTRMRPLTDKIPKPLVPLANRPLLDHVLDRIRCAGIARAVINVHYLADQIEEHVQTREQPEIIISDERDRLLDTGGGLIKARHILGGDSFLIHNSDSVWIENQHANLQNMFDVWDPDRMDTLMLLATKSNCLGYHGPGDFNYSSDGRISRPETSAHVPFVFAGVSIAHPRLLEDSPEGAFSLNLLWDRAIAAERAFGVKLEGLWMHVGTPTALAEAEQAIAKESRNV